MNAKSLLIAAVVAVGLAGFNEARAEDHGHEHGHGDAKAEKHEHGDAKAKAEDHGHEHGDAKAQVKLTLDKGKKWKTDDALKAGMTAIRDELQAALDPIHADKYSPEDYKALAGRIEAHSATIISKCKLPTDVDTQFHLVLMDIYAGTDIMKKDGKRIGGAVKIIKALASYAEYFEHPNWKPIVH